MYSEKSTNQFNIKRNTLCNYLLNNIYIYIYIYIFQIINNFSSLFLSKINVLDIMNIFDFFQIFVPSENIRKFS